jgi:hypothetical protein
MKLFALDIEGALSSCQENTPSEPVNKIKITHFVGYRQEKV